MKKIAYLLCTMCLCAVVMSACSEKNTPSEPTKPSDPEQPAKKATKAYLDFRLTVGEKMFELCTFSIDYLDKDGKEQNFVLKDTTACRLVVVSAGLPAKVGYRINISKRDDVDYSQFTEFVVDYKYDYYTGLVDDDGNIVAQGLDGRNGPKLQMDIAQMDKWLKRYNEEQKVQYMYEFDADGKETEVSW